MGGNPRCYENVHAMNSVILRGTREELESPRAKKVFAVASYASIPISCEVSTHDKLKLESPLAKSLVLSLGTECHQTLSNSMMRLLASLAPACELLGKDEFESALVDGWMSFVWHSVDVPMHVLAEIASSAGDQKKLSSLPFRSRIEAALGIVNTHLESRDFLVGSSITLADISLFVSLHCASLDQATEIPLEEGTNVSCWFRKISTTCNFSDFSSILREST